MLLNYYNYQKKAKSKLLSNNIRRNRLNISTHRCHIYRIIRIQYAEYKRSTSIVNKSEQLVIDVYLKARYRDFAVV